MHYRRNINFYYDCLLFGEFIGVGTSWILVGTVNQLLRKTEKNLY